MSLIFQTEAPKYWQHGIPVMPLVPSSKKPLVNHWQQYARDMPSEATREDWLSRTTNYNIGIPLGPQSNIMMVDIDTTDEKIYNAIVKLLPPSPWKRVGAKGCALAYKFNNRRGCNITSKNDGMIVEILSVGRQLVLPPSIHPDTNLPYQANCNLYDVLDELVLLPEDMEEQLRAMLSGMIELGSARKGSFKTSDYVPEGARDIQMTHYAGLLASEILKGEITFKEALGRMLVWCDARVAKVNGDEIDSQKGCRKIVEFMLIDITAKGKILPPGWDAELTPEEREHWNLSITEDQEEWNLQQTLDYIHSQFTDTEASDPKRADTVKHVLKKVAKSQKLDEIDKGKILTVLKDQSGLGLTMSHFNKELKKLMAGPVDGDNHTQIAQEVVNLFKERSMELRYHEDKLWIFNGTHWVIVPDQKIREIISLEYGALVAAKKNNDHKGILEVIKNIVPQELTKHEIQGINFLNGFLTRELTLLPHSPEQGMTYVMNFCYKPDEADKCYMFKDFLHYSWSEEADYENRVNMLREAMAVTLFGMATEYQQAFYLYGTGNNGKSVLLDIIDALVPVSAKCAISPTEWSKDFTLATFAGKLLNYAGEISNDKRIPGDIFKNLITGEPRMVREIYGRQFTLRSKCAHWFAGNSLPKTSDVSKGFNRRWNIFSFNKVVPADKIIRNLGQIIVEEEVEGIVAWCVAALPDLIKRGSYTKCKSSEMMVNEMAFKNSPIRLWVQEKLVPKPGAKVPITELFQAYWAYAISGHTGQKPPSKPTFREQLHLLLEETNDFKSVLEQDGEYLLNFNVIKGK